MSVEVAAHYFQSVVARRYPEPYRQSYQDYEQYPPRPEYPYTNPPYPGAFPTYGDSANYVDQSGYGEQPPTPPSPSERSESPPLQQALQHGK
jgi:hypothetical protein